MSNDNGNAVATIDPGSIMEAVIAKGDLSKLTPEERAQYYARTCDSMGLNPMTKPFEYITLNGKLTLYATRTATDQLRKINSVSLQVVSEETTSDGLRVVRVRASTPDGRTDEEIGAVNVAGLKADALANAYMKAITKAKRRATLSISGLGWIDESEIETIPTNVRDQSMRRLHAIAREHGVDHDTLHALAVQDYNVGSMTDLNAAQLGELTAAVQRDSDDPTTTEPIDVNGDVIDTETGEIIPDGDGMSEVEEEFYATLIAAKSLPALNKAAEAIRDGGVSHPALREAYRQRRDELKEPTEAEQASLDIPRRTLIEAAGV